MCCFFYIQHVFYIPITKWSVDDDDVGIPSRSFPTGSTIRICRNVRRIFVIAHVPVHCGASLYGSPRTYSGKVTWIHILCIRVRVENTISDNVYDGSYKSMTGSVQGNIRQYWTFHWRYRINNKLIHQTSVQNINKIDVSFIYELRYYNRRTPVYVHNYRIVNNWYWPSPTTQIVITKYWL